MFLRGERQMYFVSATDYLKAIPLSVGKYLPGDFYVLGTDGFGRSDNRKALSEFFEVNAENIAFSAVSGLVKNKKLDKKEVELAVTRIQNKHGQKKSSLFRII
jgi:pyruvate dehydrogenase E1 component